MEINREFKRDLYCNYMVIPAIEKDRFEARMLMENQVDGIMNLQVRSIDAVEYYYYDISSKQPIINLFERGQLGFDQIKIIIEGILHGVDEGSKYLLNENDFILDTNYIYITLSTFKVTLCYYPGYSQEISEQFINIIEYLMDKTNHTDKKAVMLVYSLYKIAKNDCSIENIKRIIRDIDVSDDLSDQEDLYILDRGTGNRVFREDNHRQLTYDGECSDEVPCGEGDEEVNVDVVIDKADANILLSSVWKLDLFKIYVGVCIIINIILYFKGLYFNADNTINYVRIISAIIICGAGAVCIHSKGAYGDEKTDMSSAYRDEEETGEMSETPYLNKETGEIFDASYIHSSARGGWDGKDGNAVCEDEESETILLCDYRKKNKTYRLVPKDTEENREITINTFPFLIGKLRDKVDYLLHEETVSRMHAKIDMIDGEQLILTDLNSKNGTSLNGERLLANETRKINHGDEIGIAEFLFILK